MRYTNLKWCILLIILIYILFFLYNFSNHDEISIERKLQKKINLIGFDENLTYTFKPIVNQDLKLLKELAQNLYGFNIIKSQELSAARDIPDTRPPRCRNIKYDENDLKPVSIVIPVFNEFYSVLLRTVTTILHRSPIDLITEIILVDDCSLYRDTLRAFEDITKSFPKVLIHRLERRSGLIKAKIIGESLAKSEIIVFFDSHTEVNVGWLPPLIAELITDPMRKVVIPTLDSIDPESFKYKSNPVKRGGFNWGLYFIWIEEISESISIGADSVKPVLTPTFSGGYFAISKKMYQHFGGFDPLMKTWGGENLEMSFRIWQCGGLIEIIPCSRVGHIFRTKRPYANSDSGNHWLENTLRMAHVWMDEYIEKFFKIKPEARDYDYGDIEDRKKIRTELKCKSFQWYLENVYPDRLSTI